MHAGVFPLAQRQNTTMAALRVLPITFAIDVFPSLSDRPPIMSASSVFSIVLVSKPSFFPNPQNTLVLLFTFGALSRDQAINFSVSHQWVRPCGFVSQKQTELNEQSQHYKELNSLNHHFSPWQYPMLIAGNRQMMTDCTLWFSFPLRCRFTLQTRMVGHCHHWISLQKQLQ